MTKKISLSGILEDLENGVVRKRSSNNYNESVKSIEEKYNLSPSEVDELFKHPKLKGRKTKVIKELSFILVDDIDNKDNITSSTEEDNTSGYELEEVNISCDTTTLDDLI